MPFFVCLLYPENKWKESGNLLFSVERKWVENTKTLFNIHDGWHYCIIWNKNVKLKRLENLSNFTSDVSLSQSLISVICLIAVHKGFTFDLQYSLQRFYRKTSIQIRWHRFALHTITEIGDQRASNMSYVLCKIDAHGYKVINLRFNESNIYFFFNSFMINKGRGRKREREEKYR